METRSLQWRSALLEGAGVLLGILIAFGIDAAWGARQDRERGDVYLDALAAELEANRGRYEDYLGQLSLQLEADATGLRDIVFAKRSLTSEDILSWVASSAGTFLTLPERAALSDILSSGGIAYIDDPSVRRLISQYAGRIDRQLATQQTLLDLWRGPMLEYYRAHASIYDMVGRVSWGYEGLPLGQGSFDVDVEAFVGNRDFANLLADRSILIGLARAATLELLSAIDALDTRLKEDA